MCSKFLQGKKKIDVISDFKEVCKKFMKYSFFDSSSPQYNLNVI